MIIKNLINNEVIYVINKYEQISFLPNNNSKRVKDKDDDNTILSKILTCLSRKSNGKIKYKMKDEANTERPRAGVQPIYTNM